MNKKSWKKRTNSAKNVKEVFFIGGGFLLKVMPEKPLSRELFPSNSITLAISKRYPLGI